MATLIQSCVETQLYATTTVKLKVNSSQSTPMELSTTNKEVENLGGWSFLQSLSNVSSSSNLNKERLEKRNVYVPPLTTSSRRLSEKSLELCTENLGCETGSSDIMASNILSSLSPSPNSSSFMEEKNQRKEYSSLYSYPSPKINNKVVSTNNSSSRKNFPPPLTTMRSNGSSSFQFRPHREDGRLVITAVEAPLRQPCFKAERSQGRLTLTFLESESKSKLEDRTTSSSTTTKFDSQVSVTSDDENDDEIVDDEEESVEVDHDFGLNDQGHHDDQQEDGDDDEESGAYVSNGMNANIFEIEVEMGMEKFHRFINGRCNEAGHKGLCNWEPALWVATS